MDPITIVLAVAGLAIGFGTNTALTKRKLGSAQDQADKELSKAKKEAAKALDEAREKAANIADQTRKEEQTRRREFKDIEQRLVAREETLDRKLDELDKRKEKLRKGESEGKELKDKIRTIR